VEKLTGVLWVYQTTTHPDRQNSVLSSIWDGGHHPRRHMYANALHRRERVGSECCSVTPSPRSVGRKMTTSVDLHHRVPTTDPGLTPQEGETLRVPSRRSGPEARRPEYSGKELWDVWTKLGGAVHDSHQRGQMVIHTAGQDGKTLDKQWNSFHLKQYYVWNLNTFN